METNTNENENDDNDIIEDIEDKESLKEDDHETFEEENEILDKEKDDDVDIDIDIDADADIDVDDVFEEDEIEIEHGDASDHENEEFNQTETDQLQSEFDEKIKNKKIYEKQMLYFQKLLHKKGFQFDENEKCILKKEDYLP